MYGKVKLICGSNCTSLGKKISKEMDIPLCKADIGRFSDGEVRVSLKESVRGGDVFIIQHLSDPVNENLMELLVIIDALKRTSARRVTVVCPYFCYARQDRKEKSRVPITAKLVANLITTAGADRVLTVDLHASQIQGFFDIPLDHLYGKFLISDYIKKNIDISKMTVVAPDVGSAKKSRELSRELNLPLAIIEKERDFEVANKSNVLTLIGEVKGRDVLIMDDMIDTGGTIDGAIKSLKKLGAKKIYIACTHPVFSGPAIERLEGADIEKIIVTDTVPIPNAKKLKNLCIISTAPLLAKAISLINKDKSLHTLFEEK